MGGSSEESWRAGLRSLDPFKSGPPMKSPSPLGAENLLLTSNFINGIAGSLFQSHIGCVRLHAFEAFEERRGILGDGGTGCLGCWQ